ncbi:MAG: polysaccharide ABC transporter ATP-binding protein [Archangium sp.]|nr:polysaccharide ABC transporter ATP-binding protein [Archangium sp.]MDP3157025.1 polysaccharide ABC transporter ATP-binding protein [Archangium sp.]MDP3575742.1 polysaccharide ABC transporter ATP-binding protein [Archangium sp.]
MSTDAIVLNNVFKSFKKTSKRNESTTMKTELVRLLKFQRRLVEPATHIEALKGIDLRIPQGSTVGIIGRNGSGKSTLLKLMTGIYSPTTGTIDVQGRISALLELGAGFHPDFTGRENILINGIILGMSRAELKERTPGIIEFAELGDFIDEPVRTYSSGMFMRLAFAVATHVDPDVLIVDEILAVGDEHFSRKSQTKMNEFRTSGKTIVLVTHDLATVQNWCSAAVWIDGGRVRMYGHSADVVNEYRRAVNAAENEGQKTGHSALDQPGLALPSRVQVEDKAPLGSVSAVRLKDGRGAAQQAFRADAPLTIEVDWSVREKAKVKFGLDLIASDGRLLLSTGWSGGELSGAGTARVELARLGLGGGVYELLLSAAGNDETVKNPFRVALHVAPTDGVGPLRPELRWSL